jgi:hypothetical protein
MFGADGGQQSHRTGQPARRECEHVLAGRIEPLQVVDRQQERAMVGEPIDDREKRGCHRALVGDAVGGLLP